MASAGAPPKAPDPATVIQAQEQANRYNTSNPFGSTSWADNGPGGHATQSTTLSPQMQAMMDQAFSSAGAPRTQMTDPFGGGMSQLASAIMGKVGKNYGLQGDSFHSTATPNGAKGGAAPQSPMGAMPGGSGGAGGGMPQMGSPLQGGGMGNPQMMNAMPTMGLAGMMPPGTGGPPSQFGQMQAGLNGLAGMPQLGAPMQGGSIGGPPQQMQGY